MLRNNAARLRVWLTIALFLTLTLLVSVGLRQLVAPLGDSVLTALQPERTYTGLLTDMRCGATTHLVASAECVRNCVHAGGSYALWDGRKLYRLGGNPQTFAAVAGEQVTVHATLRKAALVVRDIHPGD